MNKVFCPDRSRLVESRRILASINSMARTLQAEIITGEDLEIEEDLTMIVTVMSRESFAERVRKFARTQIVAVVGDRADIQEAAVEAGVRVMITTGVSAVDAGLIERARNKRVTILHSPHDTTTTTMLCRASVTMRHMVHENFLSFREDEVLREIQPDAANSNFHVFPVMDAGGRMVGILAK